jgi:hypothetical protein
MAKTFYYKDKIVVADKLSIAKQTFEFMFKAKINKSEILDYDANKRTELVSRLQQHKDGFIIPFKNGSYYFRHRNEFNPEGTFDLDKAKVYKSQSNAIALLEHLDWIRDHFVNKKIVVDNGSYPILEII